MAGLLYGNGFWSQYPHPLIDKLTIISSPADTEDSNSHIGFDITAQEQLQPKICEVENLFLFFAYEEIFIE